LHPITWRATSGRHYWAADPGLGPAIVKGEAVWTHRLAVNSLLLAMRGLRDAGYTTVPLSQAGPEHCTAHDVQPHTTTGSYLLG